MHFDFFSGNWSNHDCILSTTKKQVLFVPCTTPLIVKSFFMYLIYYIFFCGCSHKNTLVLAKMGQLWPVRYFAFSMHSRTHQIIWRLGFFIVRWSKLITSKYTIERAKNVVPLNGSFIFTSICTHILVMFFVVFIISCTCHRTI